MKVLSKEELMSINGGAIKLGFVLAVVTVSALIVGIVDGLFRPLVCRK